MAIVRLLIHLRVLALFLGAVAFVTFPANARLQHCAGTLDPSFNPEAGFPWTFALQGNKVISSINGALVRLNEDGSLDRSFLVSVSRANDPAAIYILQKDSQGRLLIAGDWAHINSILRPTIARLLPDGELDNSFSLQPPALGWTIRALAIQPDGKIVIAGSASSYYSTPTATQVIRVLENGAPDPTFKNCTANDDILALAIDPVGRILVAGKFSQFNSEGRNQFCRLLADGSLDQTFTPPRAMHHITGLKILEDGKILAMFAGGLVDLSQPLPPTTLVRFHPNGSLDTTWPEIHGGVTTLAIQPDGKYVLGGWPIRRIFPNGAIDPSFNTQTGAANVALDDQSRIVIGRGLGMINGMPRPGLARLLNDWHECVPVLTLENNKLFLVETNADLVIPIHRSRDLSSTSSVQVVTTSAKFAPRETNITFAPGVSRRDIVIPLTNNRALEPASHFTLTLTNASSSSVFGSYTRMDVTVADASSYDVPGSVDFAFATNNLMGLRPDRVSWDGKIYETWHGTNFLVRLFADESPDPTFWPPQFEWNVIGPWLADPFVQPDGKVVLAGSFRSINSVPRRNMARLNPDGSLDLSFDASQMFTSEFTYDIDVIFGLPDGSYLVGGEFYTLYGQPRHGLAHISSSGSLLNDFIIPYTLDFERIGAIAALPDGSIVAGGRSGSYYRDPNAPYLVRFTKEGILDESFRPAPGAMQMVSAIVVQKDGKIIAGGSGIKRFLTDGSVDPTFYVTAEGYIDAMALEANDDVLVRFLHESFTRPEVVRLRGGQYSGPGVCEILPVSASESGSAKVKVRRGWSSAGEARVRLTTQDATARAGVHYIATDTTITFADGESGEKEVEIPLLDHPGAANDLYFQAVITPETPGLEIAPGANIAKVTIIDNETGFILSALANSLVETGSYSFVVKRTGPYTGPSSVEIATDGGSAVAGKDYTPIRKTLYFDSPTNLSQQVYLDVHNDYLPESSKTLQMVLRNPSPGMSLLAPLTNTFILEDGPPDGFEFVHPVITAVHNQAFACISIRQRSLHGRPYGSIVLRYATIPGSAVPGVEYIPTQGTMDFSGSEFETAPKTIFVPLLATSTIGEPTTFQLKVTGLNGEPYLANDTATIVLNHPPLITPAGSIDASLPDGPGITYYKFALSTDFLYATTSFGLLRFNLDGSLDITYDSERDGFGVLAASSGAVYTYSFQSVNRLHADGKLDDTFQANLPSFLSIDHAAITPDDKLLISGTNNLAGLRSPYLLRFQTNGSIDKTFSPVTFGNASNILTAIAVQPDGRILVAGSFGSVNGIARQNFARLLPDGQVDLTFDTPASSIVAINRILVRPDNKILASGVFNYDGQQAFLARFDTNGVPDHDGFLRLEPGQSSEYRLATLDNKSRAYILKYVDNPHSASGIIRTTPEGARDFEFYPPPSIQQIVATPSALMAVRQLQYERRLIRLFPDVPAMLLNPEILPNNRLTHAGNFPANTPFALEQSNDLTHWTDLITGSTTNGYFRHEFPAPTTPTFYRLRGH